MKGFHRGLVACLAGTAWLVTSVASADTTLKAEVRGSAVKISTQIGPLKVRVRPVAAVKKLVPALRDTVEDLPIVYPLLHLVAPEIPASPS